MGKSQAIYIVHLPYRFRTAENAVCRSWLTVCQFNHFTTRLQTSAFMQVLPFSSIVAKDRFSRCTFLKVWNVSFSLKTVLQVRNVVHETFSQMAPWFQSTWLAASWKLQRNFFCFVSFAHAQSTSESKSALLVFRACTTCPKVTLVSSSTNTLATLRKNRKGSVCCCFS